MTSRLLKTALAFGLILVTGCEMFGSHSDKKSDKKKSDKNKKEARLDAAVVAQGMQVWNNLRCERCHNSEGKLSMNGLYGSKVALQSGETVVADEAYLRESITDPKAKIVAGARGNMPSFKERIDDEKLTALVTYIKSLKNAAASTASKPDKS